ncbi:MAG: hypothetical protein IKW15_04370 [Bacteroidales bacterium]|nr:hypothetical protein [Bacteroidales bacterium]
MEKEKEILSDDELKEVAGGSSYGKSGGCLKYLTPENCMNNTLCIWRNGKCSNKFA